MNLFLLSLKDDGVVCDVFDISSSRQASVTCVVVFIINNPSVHEIHAGSREVAAEVALAAEPVCGSSNPVVVTQEPDVFCAEVLNLCATLNRLFMFSDVRAQMLKASSQQRQVFLSALRVEHPSQCKPRHWSHFWSSFCFTIMQRRAAQRRWVQPHRCAHAHRAAKTRR